MSADDPDTIVVTYKEGDETVEITWEPGEEMPYAITAIEEFLGPGQVSRG